MFRLRNLQTVRSGRRGSRGNVGLGEGLIADEGTGAAAGCPDGSADGEAGRWRGRMGVEALGGGQRGLLEGAQ